MSSQFKTCPDRRQTASLKWEKYRGTDILPMWVADMDFQVAPPIRKALEKRLTHPVFGYTVGTDTTARIVCDKLKADYDWHVDPDWIVWTPGVVPALWASCAAVGEPGDEAIFNTPIYHHFFTAPGKAGKTPKPVLMRQQESGRWTYDFEALSAALSDRSRLMLLCSPHNPTGTMFTGEEMQQLATLCVDNDLVVVSDEIHCDLILSETRKHMPTAKATPELADQLITLMSPSKTFNIAGLNCGFAIISNPELRRQFRAAKQSVLSDIPCLAFTALEAAYTEADEWLKELLQQLRQNYHWLKQEIDNTPGLQMSPMEATYLAWINTDGLGIDNAAGYFEEYGVGLSPGNGFGLENYVRLNFACPKSQLEEAVNRMKKAVASL